MKKTKKIIVLQQATHILQLCTTREYSQISLIIAIVQKYVKRMPIFFARNPVCAISIAQVDLQMWYREPKKLVFSGV